jgi:hypothetical protein
VGKTLHEGNLLLLFLIVLLLLSLGSQEGHTFCLQLCEYSFRASPKPLSNIHQSLVPLELELKRRHVLTAGGFTLTLHIVSVLCLTILSHTLNSLYLCDYYSAFFM